MSSSTPTSPTTAGLSATRARSSRPSTAAKSGYRRRLQTSIRRTRSTTASPRCRSTREKAGSSVSPRSCSTPRTAACRGSESRSLPSFRESPSPLRRSVAARPRCAHRRARSTTLNRAGATGRLRFRRRLRLPSTVSLLPGCRALLTSQARSQTLCATRRASILRSLHGVISSSPGSPEVISGSRTTERPQNAFQTWASSRTSSTREGCGWRRTLAGSRCLTARRISLRCSSTSTSSRSTLLVLAS
mmetsp:Transcript_41047/g.101281  ORF Transcript_41047/g.101281 Transcript_41047/m.101281 type:complete len:246 (-) Transcript_41047:580-1317(-)